MLQDEFEAELLGQAHRGHDVVGAMAMEMNGALLLEHLDERVEIDVPSRRRRFLALGFRLVEVAPLTLEGLRLREHLALQRGDFHARVWRLALVTVRALWVLAVGELDAAEDAAGH